MTTLQDLIHQTRRHFYTETRDEMDKLAAGIDASQTTLTVQYARQGVKQGAVLSCGLEDILVWETGAQITVERGYNGTAAATHATGDLIRVNPKISDAQIRQAINDDIADLSTQGLFAETTVTVEYVAGTDTYDLAGVTGFDRILGVTYDANDGTGRWPMVDGWRLDEAADTALYPSGKALTILGYAESGRDIRVTYAKPFTALSGLSDNVLAVAGIPTTAHDIPPMGAAMRLSDGGEIARNFLTQGDTRRADEVPPQARGVSMRGLEARRRARIGAEADRLYKRWPARQPC